MYIYIFYKIVIVAIMTNIEKKKKTTNIFKDIFRNDYAIISLNE